MAAAIIVVAGLAAACSNAATTAPTSSAAANGPTAGGSTITTATVGSGGALVVAGSNGMTVYTFAKDTADSGTSACTGTCLTTWPALTVPAGSSPTAGSGAGGKIGTITRSDDGSLQVTYNGLPLYFFSGDHAKGDSNGVYTDWLAVQP